VSVGIQYRFILCGAVVLIICSATAFAGNISFYLDGAVVERTEIARNGYLEIPLPPTVRMDTLRIRPDGSGHIERVQILPRQPSRKVEKELAALTEREEQLQDRLKALAVREEIFTSAAKSQSAKAPRRSKTNPEPLTSIRQGTDYAISQLEAVYQLQRKTNRELQQLAEKRGRLARDGDAGGYLARVWLTPKSGSVTATYLQPERSWQPRYEIRTSGEGGARLQLFPPALDLARGERATFIMAPVDRAEGASPWRYDGAHRSLMTAELPVVRTLEPAGPVTRLKFTLTNTTPLTLPAGEYSCYDDGVYLGSGRLAPLEPGRSVELRCSSNQT
jgi:hypothetical protein